MATSNPTKPRPKRMIQNFHLVWLDGNIDENDDDCCNSITKLRQVVNTVNTFVDADECINFINGIKEATAFMISSGALGQTTVPIVHHKQQISVIYIFCGNTARHETWAKEWPKVKGVFTDIKPIYEALKQAAQDCDHTTVSISFAKSAGGTSSASKDTLDCSFMYTQILKEILLTIEFDDNHIKDFLTYSRSQLAGNSIELQNVDKLQKEYRHHQPIWWYTYESFLHSMLNRALRLMDVDTIVKMGFFLRDLHNDIIALHSEQLNGHTFSKPFVVYRGQNLSQTNFDQLKENQSGLLGFNNFLSTSTDLTVSMSFLHRNSDKSDLINVLFVMHIDPSIKGTPFANIQDVSYYKEENKLLFSMHSVFRIGQINKLSGADQIFEVELTLTSDDDPELRTLTEKMQEDTKGSTGWKRLGQLLIRLAQYDKAEELYQVLLKQTNNQREKAHLFDQLGSVNDCQGKYAEALGYHTKGFEILRKTLPANHPRLATSYGNIGNVYDNMGEYSKALEYHEKSLEILKTLPANDPDLASSYNNIGLVYKKMGEYSKALEYHEKSFEIKKNLPADHPDLASSYNNIGSVYKKMGEYSK